MDVVVLELLLITTLTLATCTSAQWINRTSMRLSCFHKRSGRMYNFHIFDELNQSLQTECPSAEDSSCGSHLRSAHILRRVAARTMHDIRGKISSRWDDLPSHATTLPEVDNSQDSSQLKIVFFNNWMEKDPQRPVGQPS